MENMNSSVVKASDNDVDRNLSVGSISVQSLVELCFSFLSNCEVNYL